MDALIGIAGIVFVAAVTPGPNNLIVMRMAAHSGMAGTLPLIVLIVLGGLALLALVEVGVGSIFVALPSLRMVFIVSASGYLAYLAVQLIAASFRRDSDSQLVKASRFPASAIGMFGFQFANPKSWMMVIGAVSAASADGTPLWRLALVFTAISTVCLICWSTLGLLMTQHLKRRAIAVWFDRTMGLLLIGSSLLLLKQTLSIPA